jgi:hypothetical protein
MVEPAATSTDKRRIIERHQWPGLNFESQAKQITKHYNVVYIGIDTTGLGSAVYQLVRNFFPEVKQYQYTLEIQV